MSIRLKTWLIHGDLIIGLVYIDGIVKHGMKSVKVRLLS